MQIPLLTVAMLQLADIGLTWLGMRQGLSEIDGTSLLHLVLIKLGIVALLAVLLHGRSVRAAWIACGVFTAVMLPILANNLNLILRSR